MFHIPYQTHFDSSATSPKFGDQFRKSCLLTISLSFILATGYFYTFTRQSTMYEFPVLPEERFTRSCIWIMISLPPDRDPQY